MQKAGWEQQPKPVTNKYPPVWELVLKDILNSPFPHPQMKMVCDLMVEDIKRRDEFGLQKYGTRLQPFNGRNPIKDTYEELLDAIVYTRAAIFEEEQNKIVTQDRQMTLAALVSVYRTTIESALKIKYCLSLQEGKSSNNESSATTKDDRSPQEFLPNQSNLIVPGR